MDGYVQSVSCEDISDVEGVPSPDAKNGMEDYMPGIWGVVESLWVNERHNTFQPLTENGLEEG